jgi:hypothetical protein
MRKIAITGIRKAAESVGNYLGRKSLRPIAHARRAADKATAAVVRGAQKVGGAISNLERNVSGTYGRDIRNVSAAVIKKTRHARPMPRETMGQIARRKGWVNKKYTPSERPSDMMRREGKRNNINFRDESVRPNRIDLTKRPRIDLTKKPRSLNMRETYNKPQGPEYMKYKQPEFDRSKLSYEEIKPMGRSGPRYTDKQVRAGRRVLGGAAAVGGAIEGYNYYQRQKKESR